MNREVHVRNCEGVGVKLSRATRLRKNRTCVGLRADSEYKASYPQAS